MKSRNLLVAVFSASLSFAACGGGSGSSSSGVDKSKSLTSLTDAEIVSICEYAETQLSEEFFTEAECYARGISAAQEGGDCQMTHDDCVAAAVPEPSDCAMSPDDDLPECAAMVTVGEIEACFAAQGAAYRALDISCSTTPAELEEAGNQELPQACKDIDAKCPALFSDDS